MATATTYLFIAGLPSYKRRMYGPYGHMGLFPVHDLLEGVSLIDIAGGQGFEFVGYQLQIDVI